MKKDKSRVLVVAAHPDDEVLGCGGTISRHADSGDEVYALILGEGLTSRLEDRGMVKKKEIRDLENQAKKVACILGVEDVFFAGFPDNKFDSVPILKIIKEIEKIKAITRPHIIYTHHYGDLNVDHKIVYNAVLTAFRPLKGETVREIYSFAVPSSTEWAGPERKSCFIPDRFIDISLSIDKKIKALKCYKGEIRKYPHPRSVEGVRLLAARYGLEAGFKFSEPFQTIRVVVT